MCWRSLPQYPRISDRISVESWLIACSMEGLQRRKTPSVDYSLNARSAFGLTLGHQRGRATAHLNGYTSSHSRTFCGSSPKSSKKGQLRVWVGPFTVISYGPPKFRIHTPQDSSSGRSPMQVRITLSMACATTCVDISFSLVVMLNAPSRSATPDGEATEALSFRRHRLARVTQFQ